MLLTRGRHLRGLGQHFFSFYKIPLISGLPVAQTTARA